MSSTTFQPRQIDCPNCGGSDFVPRAWGANRLDPAHPLRVVTCGRCGLCFLNPQYPAEAYEHFYTRAYFDEMGADYAEQSKTLTRDYRRAVEPILGRYLGAFPADRHFADIGAGSGTWLEIFKAIRPDHPNANIVAIEPSDMACKDLARRFPGLRVSATTLERMALPPASIDVILCSALIEHFSDPLVSLLHMNELLAPDGMLIMLTPSLERSALRRGAERFFKFVHTFYYTSGTLDALARKGGFAPVHSQVLAPQSDSLLWFPLLVTVHRKDRALGPSDAVRLRGPAEADMENLHEAEALFASLRWAFLRESAWRNLKRTIKLMLRPLLKKGSH